MYTVYGLMIDDVMKRLCVGLILFPALLLSYYGHVQDAAFSKLTAHTWQYPN